MFFKIPNAFDSHCHFLATGQVASSLSLKNLKSAEDIKNIKIETSHYQKDWLTGFGWDQNLWVDKDFPTKGILDLIFPDTPVFFSRADGHVSWINSRAINELKKKGYDFLNDPFGGKIIKDKENNLTGILLDQAHINAMKLLPEYSENQTKNFIEKSQVIFNQGGFTHVRDLSMSWSLWQILKKMEVSKNLTVCIEGFVTAENLSDFSRVLEEIKLMKANPSPMLRVSGVKIFLDGSLGSKTAYLSQNYLGSTSAGILCWDIDDVKKIIKLTWQNGLEFAIHTIGDQAAHLVVQAARALSAEGILGRIHLEHAQLLRAETIQLMKPLHITCHMQPCHWLSDHVWLAQTLPESLIKSSFLWESLRKNKISLNFGSDSPIEPASLIRNYHALNESAKCGWAKFDDDWTKYHQHADKNWQSSWTELTDEKIIQVYLKGESLL